VRKEDKKRKRRVGRTGEEKKQKKKPKVTVCVFAYERIYWPRYTRNCYVKV
jgi:hypothetical protein